MAVVAAGPHDVRAALTASIEALAAAGVDDPRLDAELLLGAAMGCERAALAIDPAAQVPASAAREFGEMVRRRLRREPVAYVLGSKGFRHIELSVDARVLVPRPETELLVEVALERRPRRVLDLGTGSGAIALAVADELPECEVVATDTSPAALEVARANAERLGLAGRVELRAGSVPEGEEFDLVLANLPYVAERDWPALEPEVTEWEPREALLAGPDGLDAYRTLFAPAPIERGRAFPDIVRESSATTGGEAATTGGEAATTGGEAATVGPEVAAAVAVEVGEGQAPAVAALARAAGFARTEVRRDLAGIERVVVADAPQAGASEADPPDAGGAEGGRR